MTLMSYRANDGRGEGEVRTSRAAAQSGVLLRGIAPGDAIRRHLDCGGNAGLAYRAGAVHRTLLRGRRRGQSPSARPQEVDSTIRPPCHFSGICE